jgi:hypothetical protein
MKSVHLVGVGLGFVAAHALAALFGGGDGVAILSGTVPTSGAAGMVVGLVYALTYFAAIVAAPILLFAAAALRLREFRQRPVR